MTASIGTEEYAANLALGHLGQPEIATMGDGTTRARKMRQFFPIARRSLLRQKHWNFATAWQQPAADPVQSPGHLKIRYVLAADTVQVRYIKGDSRREWEIESSRAAVGGVDVEALLLVTNITSPVICYTSDVTAPRLWDDMFLDGFGYELAGYAAESLGRSREFAAEMRALAKEKIGEAATRSSKERGRQHHRPETSWETRRRGRGFSGRRLW